MMAAGRHTAIYRIFHLTPGNLMLMILSLSIIADVTHLIRFQEEVSFLSSVRSGICVEEQSRHQISQSPRGATDRS